MNSFNKHGASPLRGLLLVALSRKVYNMCLSRGSKFYRETDEEIRTVPGARVAERNVVGGKESGDRRSESSPLPGRREGQTYHPPDRRHRFRCRDFKMVVSGPDSSLDIFYLAPRIMLKL